MSLPQTEIYYSPTSQTESRPELRLIQGGANYDTQVLDNLTAIDPDGLPAVSHNGEIVGVSHANTQTGYWPEDGPEVKEALLISRQVKWINNAGVEVTLTREWLQDDRHFNDPRLSQHTKTVTGRQALDNQEARVGRGGPSRLLLKRIFYCPDIFKG